MCPAWLPQSAIMSRLLCQSAIQPSQCKTTDYETPILTCFFSTRRKGVRYPDLMFVSHFLNRIITANIWWSVCCMCLCVCTLYLWTITLERNGLWPRYLACQFSLPYLIQIRRSRPEITGGSCFFFSAERVKRATKSSSVMCAHGHVLRSLVVRCAYSMKVDFRFRFRNQVTALYHS